MVKLDSPKVGLVGAGLQGHRRFKAMKQTGLGELVIVADSDLRSARDLAAEAGCIATTEWENVLERPDVQIVVVCTPPHLHAQVSVKAMRRGKHVLCEKPLAINVAEAQSMVEAARESKARLKCGFNLRHHPGIQQAKRWLDRGQIGSPVFLRLCYGIGGRPGYEAEWRAKKDIAGGGQLMDQGMHALDLSRWFMGDFHEVLGMLQTGFWDIAPLEDNAFALLRSRAGGIASLHASWTQWKNLFSLELFGRDGYVKVHGLGGSYGEERAILGQRDFSKPFTEQIIEFRGEDRSWNEEWLEFVDAIMEYREPLSNGFDGLEAMRLAQAVYESADTGQMVRL